jgi:hypothetical protein
MENNSEAMPIKLLPVIALVLMVFGYASPWLATTGTSLISNAYDLAEWGSLHPTVRATSQILLPALLLRIPLPVIGLLSLLISRRNPLLWAIVLGVWIALIPAVPFFRGEFTDANYLQQFVIWFAYTCVCVFLLLFSHHYRVWIGVGLCISGLICGVVGAYRTLDLMGRYQIMVQVGWGFWLWGIACLIYVVATYQSRETLR